MKHNRFYEKAIHTKREGRSGGKLMMASTIQEAHNTVNPKLWVPIPWLQQYLRCITDMSK